MSVKKTSVNALGRQPRHHRILAQPGSQILTDPFVATALFIVGFYGLYLGGIFDAAVGNHAAHVAMNLHFLLSGYLFYWVVIGVDPTPRPIPSLAKLGMVFASLPLRASFGDGPCGDRAAMAQPGLVSWM